VSRVSVAVPSRNINRQAREDRVGRRPRPLGMYVRVAGLLLAKRNFCIMSPMRKKQALVARKAPVATADVIAFRPTDGGHAAIAHIPSDEPIFRQGEPCDALFYLRVGAAKVHVLSKSGREAVIMILGPGDFFGESAMLHDAPRICSVTTITPCTVERIESAEAWRRLREEPSFARVFMDFVVNRNRRYLIDLSGHHFYPTEKRLARPAAAAQGQSR